MPRYDFQCEDCGETVERNVPHGEFVTVCPSCLGKSLRLPHYGTLKFTVPTSFHTDTREVLGDVKEQLKRGEIVPAPGNRWA